MITLHDGKTDVPILIKESRSDSFLNFFLWNQNLAFNDHLQSFMPHQQGNIIIQPITSICFQQSFPVTVHLKQEASALPTTSSSSLGPFIDPFSQYSIYHGGAAEKKKLITLSYSSDKWAGSITKRTKAKQWIFHNAATSEVNENEDWLAGAGGWMIQ